MASVVKLLTNAQGPAAGQRPLPVQRHPNAFDLRRIERVLDRRKRYRYVSPRVGSVEDGYLIESPCCSRSIDAEGGLIDVALLRYAEDSATWYLYHKNHEAGTWAMHSTYLDLNALLEYLNDDPEREFWQ